MASTEQKTSQTQPNPHALIFALHLQGHVNPSVNLAVKLASQGFTITFVNTELTHHKITTSQLNENDDDIFVVARKTGLDIRYTTVSDGFPLSFDRAANFEEFLNGNLEVFPSFVDQVVGKIVESDPSVCCLIADTFFGWPSMIAKKYNLVNVSFWTEPALVFSLYYHLDLLKINGHFAAKENRDDSIGYIPGVKAIEPKDLPSYLQETDLSKTLMHQIINKGFQDVKNADFILCNTIQELENDVVSALIEKQPFYTIGPLFPPGFLKSVVPTNFWSEFDCTQWLNDKPRGTVLYVSFGSMSVTDKATFEEIANGLLLSQVNFIWVLRRGLVKGEQNDVVWGGFEEEVRGRGLIVPWCNQIEVISHPAIGGFLTHCGWNSMLEGVWCGLPLLCFPLFTDQLTNRKMVVDDWRAGLNLCDRKPLMRVEVAEKISRLMSGNSGQNLRKEVKQVKKTLENALAKDGSSQKNFCQFISNVKDKITKLRK
ncbi:hypothetical protein UlMin_005820 [Ulmus minor]